MQRLYFLCHKMPEWRACSGSTGPGTEPSCIKRISGWQVARIPESGSLFEHSSRDANSDPDLDAEQIVQLSCLGTSPITPMWIFAILDVSLLEFSEDKTSS